ncbi:MAG: tRNA (adenosine(37)-N6)-dimethylallyltransferase MiaA [Nitrospirae bacterium]|nr:tRNA (adenosine(37)-N6)-dimethylallyltransferase MiaA [Nitrospirota bacterium]
MIILLGPTGVGKTSASILLAKELGTEIISADSMQIYMEMDIGTAKPSKEQMAEVKHHMIDIVEPSENYSVGRYIERVVPIIETLHKKGNIPIIVGGTGLYIKAMTRGIFSGPSADWKLRKELIALEEEQTGILYNYLLDLDPNAAQKIMPTDTRRVIRGIEICLKSERGISELQKELTKPLPYEFVKIGLTRDRKELYGIIENRVDDMIKTGLLDEVKGLLERFTHSPIHPFTDSPSRTDLAGKPIHLLTSMQAIGYKEIAMYINGDITLEDAVRLIKRGTKRYAKRQFTWFKKEDNIHWIDVSGIHDSSEIFLRIKHVLGDLLS